MPPKSPKGPKEKKKKEKKKTPQQIIKELTETNEQQLKELESLQTQLRNLTNRTNAILQKIVDNVDKKAFWIDENTDLQLVDTDIVLEMIQTLAVKKQIHDVSVEQRVEELEARVSRLNHDLVRMTKKTAAYEAGLDKITYNDSLEKIHDKVNVLRLIAGQEYHLFDANDAVYPFLPYLPGTDTSPDLNVVKTLQNAHKLNLHMPKEKLPGETSVKNMFNDLKLLIVQELSQEKSSGSDWRMLAVRVGIPGETVELWSSYHLQHPAAKVLMAWEKDPTATVRMLHRHLISPQMRCTLLAKRIADFYNVH